MCSHRRSWVGSHSQAFLMSLHVFSLHCWSLWTKWVALALQGSYQGAAKTTLTMEVRSHTPDPWRVVTHIQLSWASAVYIREVCLDTILFAHPIFPKIQNMFFIDTILVFHQCLPLSFPITSLHPQNGSEVACWSRFRSLLKCLLTLKKGCQISLK